MEHGCGGRHGGGGESVPFSSLTSPSLPISLCSSALTPAGETCEARAGVRDTQRRRAVRAAHSVCRVRPDPIGIIIIFQNI